MAELGAWLYKCPDPVRVQAQWLGKYGTHVRDIPMYTRCWKRSCEMCGQHIRKCWAGRLIAESLCHPATSFVTLTYDDDHVPETLQDGYKDIQLWLKTLRNRDTETVTDKLGQRFSWSLPKRFRYFVSGELGPENDRPHWHCVLFGMPTAVHAKMNRVRFVDTTWRRGFVTWSPATVSNMSYAACYSVKKSDEHENFYRPSKHPALGDVYWLSAGKQVARLGKLPQSIQSLKIGPSHFPLAQRAKEMLIEGFQNHASDELLEIFFRNRYAWESGARERYELTCWCKDE